AAVVQLFNWHLKGTGGPLPWGVRTWTQACGGSAQVGPFTAPDWDALHPGEVRLGEPGAKTFGSGAGDALDANADNPIADPSNPSGSASTSCRTVPSSADDPAAATYRFPVVDCPYTLMGSPTVVADLAVSGEFSEIAARLW